MLDSLPADISPKVDVAAVHQFAETCQQFDRGEVRQGLTARARYHHAYYLLLLDVVLPLVVVDPVQLLVMFFPFSPFSFFSCFSFPFFFSLFFFPFFFLLPPFLFFPSFFSLFLFLFASRESCKLAQLTQTTILNLILLMQVPWSLEPGLIALEEWYRKSNG